ncbi:AAA family ATPase [Methylobacterium sp. J-070]|uniref:AAA family ATPase n=1 Tax=Methylobacterium sp. J-070 TaxID=2836650 RepID=UPI001FBA7BE7|nr:ATP-binding protein [Methylobacterium sp. J-070]MCJ2050867.1 ATP-binding protein [Methylobacterium sp. J-070]
MSTSPGDEKTRSHAALQNVRMMMALVRKLQGRRPHLPNIGVMHGPSGYGKSQAAIYAQNKSNAVRVEVGDSWTRRTLMKAILVELGVTPRGTVADMVERAVELLGEEIDRPLMIDEADKLVDKGMIELVREIAECSQAPVILIGEEALPSKLVKVERVHNRVLDWAPAEPCDREDTRKLADLYTPHLTLSDGLLDRVCERSEGRARRIVTNLDHIAEWARHHGAQAVDEGYDGRFFTGEAPKVRAPARLLRRVA